MDLRLLHDSDVYSELEQNRQPPDGPSLSLSPCETPELGHENDSGLFPESYQPWRCSLPSRQLSPRTPNFIEVASELDIARPSKADMNGVDEDSLSGNGIDDNFYASLSHETPANPGDAGLIHDGFPTTTRQTIDSSFGLGTTENSRRPNDSSSPTYEIDLNHFHVLALAFRKGSDSDWVRREADESAQVQNRRLNRGEDGGPLHFALKDGPAVQNQIERDREDWQYRLGGIGNVREV